MKTWLKAVLVAIGLGGLITTGVVINNGNNTTGNTIDSTHQTTTNIDTPSTVIYGFNGNVSFSGQGYSSKPFLDSLKKYKIRMLRWSGGTISNWFNWRTGLSDSSGNTPMTVPDIINLHKYVGCDIMIVLNVVTMTFDDQVQMLDSLKRGGVPIKYVEIGNELNNEGNFGRIKYPTPEAYRDTLKRILPLLHSRYQGVIVGAVGENKRYKEAKNWNDVVLQANPDRLVTHPYVDPYYFATPEGNINYKKLDSTLYKTWFATGFDKIKRSWATEYNYNYESKQHGITFLTDSAKENFLVYQSHWLKNHGVELMLIHNIESSKENSAFEVEKNFIKN